MADQPSPVSVWVRLVKWEGSFSNWLGLLINLVALVVAAYFGLQKKDAEYLPTYLFVSSAILFSFLVYQVYQSLVLRDALKEHAEARSDLSRLRSSITGAGTRYPALIGAVAEFQHRFIGPALAALRQDSAEHERLLLRQECDRALKDLLTRVADSTRALVAARHAQEPDAASAKIRLLFGSKGLISYETVARSANNNPKSQPYERNHALLQNHFIYSRLRRAAHDGRLYSNTNHKIDAEIGKRRSQYPKPQFDPDNDYSVMCVPIFGPPSGMTSAEGAPRRAIEKYDKNNVLIGFLHVYSNSIKFDSSEDGDILKEVASLLFSSISIAEIFDEHLR